MFRGNHPTRVDEKGRLKVPAEFKRVIDEKYGAQFYITSLDGKSAQVYPFEEWERIEQKLAALYAMRDFLYERVYESKGVREEFAKAQRILEELWSYFHEHEDEFRARHWLKATRADETLDRAIGDFLCGMTDRYAMRLYQEKRLPKPWTVY